MKIQEKTDKKLESTVAANSRPSIQNRIIKSGESGSKENNTLLKLMQHKRNNFIEKSFCMSRIHVHQSMSFS